MDEWAASTDSDLLHWPMYERCRALLAAGRGDVAEARRWASRGARRRPSRTGSAGTGSRRRARSAWPRCSTRTPRRPSRQLGAVWEHTEREGVLDPGAFPAGPDLVEALVEVEEYDAARDVVDGWPSSRATQDHPWARLGAQRATALVDIYADAYTDEAGEALEATAASYRELGLAFD